jgi:dihydroflavonol-4-reductase
MDRPRSFDLVTIQPYVVWGPSRIAALNPSNRILADLVGGRFPGVVALTWGVVDVRDAAAAHLLALDTPGASGRYLCSGGAISMRALVGLLNGLGVSGRWPRLALDGAIGLAATRGLAALQGGGIGSYLQTHLGRAPRIDTSKIRRELGARFRPIEDTVRDTVLDLARRGHIPQSAVARVAAPSTTA